MLTAFVKERLEDNSKVSQKIISRTGGQQGSLREKRMVGPVATTLVALPECGSPPICRGRAVSSSIAL